MQLWQGLFMEVKVMILMCSIDWFAVSCVRCGALPAIGVHFRLDCCLGQLASPSVCVVDGQEYHKMFARSITILYKKLPLLHVFFEPKGKGMRPDQAIAKAANRLLYMRSWAVVVSVLCRQLNLARVGINRIDVCGDFNAFNNGLAPKAFVQRYFSQPTERRPSYIRHASNVWRACGQKNVYKECVAVNDFQTLSFGTRESKCQTNLYNKSEELRAGHDKPYIRQCWVEAGLDPNCVWRVEFSLNSRGVVFHDLKTGYIDSLQLSDLAIQSYVDDLFLSLAKQYFSFHEYYKGERRGLRSIPFVSLFDQPSTLIKPANLSYAPNTSRRMRDLSSALAKVRNNCVDLTPGEIKAFDKVLELLQELGFTAERDITADCLSYFAESLYVHAGGDMPACSRVIRRWAIEACSSKCSSEIQNLKEAVAEVLATKALHRTSVDAPKSVQRWYESPSERERWDKYLRLSEKEKMKNELSLIV